MMRVSKIQVGLLNDGKWRHTQMGCVLNLLMTLCLICGVSFRLWPIKNIPYFNFVGILLNLFLCFFFFFHETSDATKQLAFSSSQNRHYFYTSTDRRQTQMCLYLEDLCHVYQNTPCFDLLDTWIVVNFAKRIGLHYTSFVVVTVSWNKCKNIRSDQRQVVFSYLYKWNRLILVCLVTSETSVTSAIGEALHVRA
jgi:hypothetical protein